MKKTFTLLLLLVSSNSVQANDAVAQASEYAKQGMVEIASNPPLLLLKNEKDKSRHEIQLSYVTLDSDDDATLTSGTIAQENGDAKGYGFSYGYSWSFKERWAFVTWLQGITVEQGNHTQKISGVTSAKAKDFDALNMNLAFGLSYEFFRENPNHTLNVFAGPSIMYLDFHSDIENYNTSTGNLDLSLDFFFDTIIPTAFLGFMYEYKYFENWQISPYALGVLRLTDKCQAWEADRVSVNTGSIDGSSPECSASGNSTKGEIDIAPSFVSIGVKFHYRPWDLGFNVSSFLNNLILRSDDDKKAEVTGINFSFSKSWGNF